MLGGGNSMQINLTQLELEACLDFATRSAQTQREEAFGQTGERRTRNQIEVDTRIGKVAELAFSKMLENNFGIATELDWGVYPRGEYDECDVTINGWRFDIKGTKQRSKWLLVEDNKIRAQKKDNALCHFYILVTVAIGLNAQPTGSCEIRGYAPLEWFRDEAPCKRLRRGMFIPKTQTPLKADNYAFFSHDLRKDWDFLIRNTIQKQAPSLSSFKLFKV